MNGLQKSKQGKIDGLGFMIPGIVVAFWYIITTDGRVPSYLLPSPQSLLQVLMDFATGTWNLTPYAGTMWGHAFASTSRVLQGFGIAALLGLTLGLLTGRIALLKRLFDPSVNLIRAIPGIGWLPLAMVWFGVGENTSLFLIALAAFFPIYINAAQGASAVSPLLLRAGKMLGASKVNLFLTVIIPAAFPALASGLRLGLGISWAYVVLGELTGVTQGLGAVMMDARMLGYVDVVMVCMIYIAVLGWLSDRILRSLCSLLQAHLGGV